LLLVFINRQFLNILVMAVTDRVRVTGPLLVMAVSPVGMSIAAVAMVFVAVSFVDYRVLTRCRAGWSCLLGCWLLLLGCDIAKHANCSKIPVSILRILVSSAVKKGRTKTT
jgi:hypothetical protein